MQKLEWAAAAARFSEGSDCPTIGAWRTLQLCRVLIAPPKAAYGLAPSYHMPNTREASALGNRKKEAGVSVGMRT